MRLQDVRFPHIRLLCCLTFWTLVLVGTAKHQVTIRRPAHSKPHPRTRIEEEEDQTSNTPASSSTTPVVPDQDTRLPTDELTRIRALLHPPPILDVDDWGIPRESSGPCDSDVEVRNSLI